MKREILCFCLILTLHACKQISSKDVGLASSKHIPVLEKMTCKSEEQKKDTVFNIDNMRVQFSYQLLCDEKYELTDTLVSEDSIKIHAYQNRFVQISMKTPNKKVIEIRKELFATSLGEEIIKPLQIGETRVESIDVKNKNIVFSTFLGFPNTETGMTVLYVIDLSGDFRYVATEDRQAGD